MLTRRPAPRESARGFSPDPLTGDETMYNVSINVRGTGDLRTVTLAGDSLDPLTVDVVSVPNGDGSMWWEVTEDSREMIGQWMGIDSYSPPVCRDWVLDLEVQIVERVAAVA